MGEEILYMTPCSDCVAQNPMHRCPTELLNRIVSIPVSFAMYPGGFGEGIIEVHRDVADDVEECFRFMLAKRFPLWSVKPVAYFHWSDERSMAANNTSGFNYRFVEGTQRLSKHANGRAIDINPEYNPCVANGVICPAHAAYEPSQPGTFTATSPVTLFLKERGWIWGGDWESPIDYQHFEKPE